LWCLRKVRMKRKLSCVASSGKVLEGFVTEV
jgi:hypothetical protein